MPIAVRRTWSSSTRPACGSSDASARAPRPGHPPCPCQPRPWPAWRPPWSRSGWSGAWGPAWRHRLRPGHRPRPSHRHRPSPRACGSSVASASASRPRHHSSGRPRRPPCRLRSPPACGSSAASAQAARQPCRSQPHRSSPIRRAIRPSGSKGSRVRAPRAAGRPGPEAMPRARAGPRSTAPPTTTPGAPLRAVARRDGRSRGRRAAPGCGRHRDHHHSGRHRWVCHRSGR